jgi:vibriolysin
VKNHRWIRALGVVFISTVMAACQGTDDPNDEHTGERSGERSGSDIQASLDALPDARVVDVDQGGVPSFVAGLLGAVDVKEDAGEVDMSAALAAIAPVFRASSDELVLKSAFTDAQGDQHFRYRQVKDGLDVIGGEIVVHVRDGVIFAANGNARGDLAPPDGAIVSLADAVAAAFDGSSSVVGLVVGEHAPLAYRLAGERLDLVYQVDVTGVRADETPVHDTVLVNAVDGTIIDRIAHIHTAKNREMHNLNHGTSLPGPIARTEGGAPSADAIVNNNYDRLGSTYDCYQVLFGRDSFDNAGAKLISSVHYSNNYVNAFWDGTQMVYGDGDNVTASNLANSMDVTAHELTHAVTERTSNLIYSGESGGLNEAMSDIFGNVCEWYRDGQVVSANTWKVGEDVWTPGTANDALRYMNTPTADGGSLDYYPDYSNGVDVHYSSGIANLAFFLLSQGGTHPGGKTSTVVTGIGIAKAAQVFYRANTTILTASSTFAQAKTATEQAATQLGYTAAEIASVTAAWAAVGVGVPVPPPAATPLSNNVPVVGISGATGNNKYYTLEVPAGATNLAFTITGGTGDADLYVRFGDAPTTSTYDCRPYLGGNNETCTVVNAQAGTYWVMLRGYAAYTGVTLTGSYVGDGGSGGSGGGGGGGGTGHLTINEVDYDNSGTDNTEFIEIYNGTGAAVDLADYSVVLVNGGNNAVYKTFSLSSAGTLAAGEYLVIGSTSVGVPAGAKKINFTSQTDQIQNGAPDGVALIAGGALIDALSYEGSITAANIPGVGVVSLVEGTAYATGDTNSGNRSLCRDVNGGDTDNAANDWDRRTRTPGAPN